MTRLNGKTTVITGRATGIGLAAAKRFLTHRVPAPRAPRDSLPRASKAAVRSLARTWAEDLKGTGLRVNVLSPGPTATELAKAELGAAAAFLASSDSSFMIGSEVAVDGGLAQV